MEMLIILQTVDFQRTAYLGWTIKSPNSAVPVRIQEVLGSNFGQQTKMVHGVPQSITAKYCTVPLNRP